MTPQEEASGGGPARGVHRTLNLLFAAVAVGGFVLIFWGEPIAAHYGVATEAIFFAPMALVAAQALITALALRRTDDPVQADHHLDSIYFAGFLFTLISLVALFYQLRYGRSVHSGAAEAEFMVAVHFVGISVSTSIAGVLGRNIARGYYLQQQPVHATTLEQEYRRTFEAIRLFLTEREEHVATLAAKEGEYLTALERFGASTAAFATQLDSSRERIETSVDAYAGRVEAHAAGIARLNDLSSRYAQLLHQMAEGAQRLPYDAISAELERFGEGTRELNLVIDDLLVLLQHKVKKIA